MKSFVRIISKISGHRNILRKSPILTVCCIKHLLHATFFNTRDKKNIEALSGGIHIDVAVPLSNTFFTPDSCIPFAPIKVRKCKHWCKSIGAALIVSKGDEIIKRVKDIGKLRGIIEEECSVLSSYVYIQQRIGNINFRITEVS